MVFIWLVAFFLVVTLIVLVIFQVPSTNWVHVMENLDHEGFSIPDEAAFCLLMNIYGRACKALRDFASLTPGNHAWSCLDLLEENHDSGKEVY
ncbi:hypothetical protein D1007_42678 [Hordeum vulgare]|nr:hypothetical protein D1007_42678 [Hordeum vulgare]